MAATEAVKPPQTYYEELAIFRLITQHLQELSVPGDRFSCAEGIRRRERHIVETLTRVGASLDIQEFVAWGAVGRNIIARVGAGGEPQLVIGAHYDSVPRSPGANDNGSAVACLLALIETISTDTGSTWRPLEVCFWDMEEVDKRGSKYHVLHSVNRVQADTNSPLTIVLDMVGTRNRTPFSQRIPAGIAVWSPRLAFRWLSGAMRGDFHLVVGRRQDLLALEEFGGAPPGAWALRAPEDVQHAESMGLCDSDHASYWRQHQLAILVTDTGPMRSATYHTARDCVSTVDISFVYEIYRWALRLASC